MTPSMNITIRPITIPVRDGLELRQRQPEEAEELFALTDENRAYLRRWLPWVDHCNSPTDTRKHIEATLRQAEEGSRLALNLWHQGRIVGVTGYCELFKDNRTGHIGYWLGEAHGGKGLMTASVRALVDYGFRELGLNRQIIAAASGNLRSRAVAERLGFSLEGIAREAEWLYDHFVDHAVYALLRKDQPVVGHTP
jgi:ribosomal-protein-serine acetyltransferase